MTNSWKGSVSGAALLCVAASHGARAQEGVVALPDVTVAATPVPGAVGIDANKVPGVVTSIPAKDFEQRRSPSVADTITSHVPAAIAINVDGSDLSPDLFYRGFDVSRISGSTNGLAVYENGVRINEAFGDGVNLDLIPPIAIQTTNIYTNNPIFGLNALGGAINFITKNGFNYHGGDATILGGSYGRINGFLQYGKQVGNYAMYAAVDGYRDGGYRPFGAQNAERVLVDLGYRSQDSEIHAIGIYGRSLLGVQGVTPQVLVNQQYNSVFTTPQTTENSAGIAQLTGRFDVSPHWSIASNFYVRQFDQYHVDGNDADVAQCDDNAGSLCLDDDNAPAGTPTAALHFKFHNGSDVPFDPNVAAYGTTARTATHTTTFGTQQQATNRDTFFGHENYFVVGGSIDTSSTNFASATSLGSLNTQFQNIESGFAGAGTILQTAGNLGFAPTYLHSNATYYGVFALDTFNITEKLALTAGARLNIAKISNEDLTGEPDNANLNSSNTYTRINPVVGLTYKFARPLTVYAGYSEANRAPTPLESSCADQFRPCVLETALVSDPTLQQVVSHTVEAGARGDFVMPKFGGVLSYKAGYFRTNNSNDIIALPSAQSGQGFFSNVPGTLRQGVELGAIYNKGPWSFYANYGYIDATYRFNAQLSSPNNPFADGNGNINVTSGNHIPGIPRNLGKLGFEYAITPRLTVGMDTILVGSQYFSADDSNQNPRLPFYYVVNVRSSYQVTDHVQVFGLINNLTNNKYATFGTFYGTDTSAGGVNATLANNVGGDARAITVAQPLSFYGGVKVSF